MPILLKMNTGFAGDQHVEELDMTMSEWDDLSEDDREQYISDMVANHIDVFVEEAD